MADAIRLGVNVDHVATLREARKISEPDPVYAAAIAELAGADQITVHLREDRRHIQERDVELMRKMVKTVLNLEMAATQEMIKLALFYKPDTVTLVPERREELTTEGGLNVSAQRELYAKTVRLLQDADITVSLFVNPDLDQIKDCHRIGADAIEIHTGRYAESHLAADREKELERIINAAKLAARLGLYVAAGHGLDYRNVGAVAAIREIQELNIGHSIVGRSVLSGLAEAVKDMKSLMRVARQNIV